MADVIDQGNEHTEMFLQIARGHREAVRMPTGYCFYCEEALSHGATFCSKDCSEDWHKEQRILKLAGKH